jgi:hypothetical protein
VRSLIHNPKVGTSALSIAPLNAYHNSGANTALFPPSSFSERCSVLAPAYNLCLVDRQTPRPMTDIDELLPLEAAMRGLLALEVVKREERLGSPDERATALVLADAGLSAPAIALLTNRNVGAVRKATERARKKERGK